VRYRLCRIQPAIQRLLDAEAGRPLLVAAKGEFDEFIP